MGGGDEGADARRAAGKCFFAPIKCSLIIDLAALCATQHSKSIPDIVSIAEDSQKFAILD